MWHCFSAASCDCNQRSDSSDFPVIASLQEVVVDEEKTIGWHSDDVAEPSQLSLHNSVLRGVAVCSATNLHMGKFEPPMQTKYPLMWNAPRS